MAIWVFDTPMGFERLLAIAGNVKWAGFGGGIAAYGDDDVDFLIAKFIPRFAAITIDFYALGFEGFEAGGMDAARGFAAGAKGIELIAAQMVKKRLGHDGAA